MSRTSLRTLARFAALTAATAAVAMSAAATAEAQPAASVSQGPITVSNVKIVGTAGNNYTTVTPGTGITVTGNYKVVENGGSIDQVEIGWAGSDAPLGCVYSGGSGQGTFSFDLGAPPTSGLNQVIVNYGQDFDCNTSGWWVTNTGPVIADVAVTAPVAASNGPASISKAKIVGLSSNTSTQPSGAIRFSGKYAWGSGTGGSVNQIQIGWSGSTAPKVCLELGAGAVRPTAFSVNLGPAPTKGANYIVFGYAQLNSCTTSAWFVGTDYSAVGLVYDNHV